MTKKKHPCPQCGETKNVVEIVYGYPGPDLMEMHYQGKVKLGGCVVSDNDPDLYCMQCKKEFSGQEQ